MQAPVMLQLIEAIFSLLQYLTVVKKDQRFLKYPKVLPYFCSIP